MAVRCGIVRRGHYSKPKSVAVFLIVLGMLLTNGAETLQASSSQAMSAQEEAARAAILNRAKSWATAAGGPTGHPGVPYNQRAYYPDDGGYRQDCSGFV